MKLFVVNVVSTKGTYKGFVLFFGDLEITYIFKKLGNQGPDNRVQFSHGLYNRGGISRVCSKFDFPSSYEKDMLAKILEHDFTEV